VSFKDNDHFISGKCEAWEKLDINPKLLDEGQKERYGYVGDIRVDVGRGVEWGGVAILCCGSCLSMGRSSFFPYILMLFSGEHVIS